jgi:hypothetical protein
MEQHHGADLSAMPRRVRDDVQEHLLAGHAPRRAVGEREIDPFGQLGRSSVDTWSMYSRSLLRRSRASASSVGISLGLADAYACGSRRMCAANMRSTTYVWLKALMANAVTGEFSPSRESAANSWSSAQALNLKR